MNPIELGKFIANLRNEKNLTQEELAEKLFIDKRKVSRWECGTSIPEFDMLIKLSEILDVSLYELSICKRLNKESISRKTLNTFKNIKDFKKYKLKKKIIIIISIIILIFFLITTIYTIKYNGSIEIYELKSLDDNYYIEGNYIKTKDYSTFNIKHIGTIDKNKKENGNSFINCEFGIYSNDIRVFYLTPNNKFNDYYNEFDNDKILNDNIVIKVECNKKKGNITFNAMLVKKVDNRLF